MKKKIGYWLYAAFFTVFRLFPLNRDKVFFVATHDDSDEGNIGIVAEEIRRQMPEKKMVFLTKRDGIRHPFSFFIGKAFHMATAGTIFMDNHFLPMAYTPISKKAKVVQLWHGTGTIKKFGLDAESGEVARLAAKANARTTHLIVGSERTKRQYATAFGMPEEKIYVLGLPRTDRMLDEKWLAQKRARFLDKYPELKDKRRILYAPTFRDREVEHPKVALDLEKFAQSIDKDTVFMLRLHPHVAGNLEEADLPEDERIRNVSGYPGVTTLLAVADVLVTDYSSIVYEYCLLGRPVCFYAYDLDEFEKNGRDFYEDYRTFVPGPVVENAEELAAFCQQKEHDVSRIAEFVKDNYAYLDKNAVKRLFELIFA